MNKREQKKEYERLLKDEELRKLRALETRKKSILEENEKYKTIIKHNMEALQKINRERMDLKYQQTNLGKPEIGDRWENKRRPTGFK